MATAPRHPHTPDGETLAQLEQRNHELAPINRIIAATAALLEPRAVAGAVCRELGTAFGAPQAAEARLNDSATVEKRRRRLTQAIEAWEIRKLVDANPLDVST